MRFPDVTNIQVEIVSTAPGLSPLEIEKFVTYPIEMSMRGLPKLQSMRSITKYGLSVVTLVFHDDVDVYFARQLVFERLSSVTERLPEGVSTEMGPVATAMGEIYQYTLEGKPPADAQERIKYFTDLRTLQDWVIAPLLKNVPGVSEINSFGGYLRQFQVIVDPDKLLSYGLSVKQVFEAIRNNNQNVGGNIVTQASEQYIVRGVGLIRSEEDIGNIVLAAHDGAPVFLNHVARVEVGHAVRQGSALKNGEGEAVGGIVMMLKGENSLEVVHRVQEKVREINEGTVLPASLKIVPYYERSEIVGQSIRTVVQALAEGSLLVLVVLYLLLRSIRGALIVIFALPLSLLLTVIVMKYAGLYANLMSLGGLAISIGMIIDATIIQVENVQRHLGTMTDKSHKLATVLKAVLEVRKPSIFGELIIALIFIPIITLQGMEGKMFSPLAYAVAIALFASLFLSILVIPVLCALVLRHGHEKESLVVRTVRRAYVPLLNWSLRHRASTVVIAVLFVGVALLLVPHLGTEFVPIMDEGAFDMDVQMLPGISLENATEITDRIEKKLKQFPELKTVLSRTGQTGLALEARGVDKTGFVGDLKPRSEWTSARTREELFGKMRDAVAVIPGIAFSFSQPIQCRIDEMVAGTRAQVIIKLFGDDTDILQQKTAEIAKVVAPIAGVTDLVTEVVAGQPYITIQIDRNRIARYGINVNDVLSVVEIAVGGKAASQVYEENRFFDLTVRFPEEKRSSVEAIGDILIDSPAGARVPLQATGRRIRRGRAGADQPGGRPAPHGHRIQHQGTRHGQRRARSPGTDRKKGHAAQRLLPGLGRSIREPAASHETTGDHPADGGGADPAAAVHHVQFHRAGPAGRLQSAVCPGRGRVQPADLRLVSLGARLRRVHRLVRRRGPQRRGAGLLRDPVAAGGDALAGGDLDGMRSPLASHHDDGLHHGLQPHPHAGGHRSRLGGPASACRCGRGRSVYLDPGHAACAADSLWLV